MSNIGEIIARVDAAKFNEFTEQQKLRWISLLDGQIAEEVYLLAPQEAQQYAYRYPEDMGKSPLVDFPNDDIYDLWLIAQIEFHHGEYEKYQNTMEMFNSRYGAFVKWFLTYYAPERELGNCDRGVGGGKFYYITAYGLAVKQGYSGTLEEWLRSLKGEKGDPGTVAFEELTEEQVEMLRGKPGTNGVSVTHTWQGTVLTVTSAAGTSSADLQGPKGDRGSPLWTEDTNHPGCLYRVVGDETEWLNPPMIEGVEYRTAERCHGVPVYCVAVSGTSAEGDNYFDLPKEIPAGHLVSVTGQVGDYPMPFGSSDGGIAYSNWVHHSVAFSCSAAYAELVCRFVVKYTKGEDSV